MDQSPLMQKFGTACIAMGLTLIMALTVCTHGSVLRAADPDAERALRVADLRRQILDALLALPDLDGQRSNQLLRMHGSIRAEEISYLVSMANSDAKSMRWNATRLLTIARPPEEGNVALRHLVATSDDPGVVVLALASLLDFRDE